MVARGDGMCCPFVSLTAGKRAALPSPAGDHEGHPYGSSGLLPLFMASVDAYWATLVVALLWWSYCCIALFVTRAQEITCKECDLSLRITGMKVTSL